MTGPKQHIRFLLLLIISVGLLITVELAFTGREAHPAYERMKRASVQASEWFRIIERTKEEKRIQSPASAEKNFRGMLGDEYSEITTTLGSFGAKIASTNPQFAAMFVRVLHDCGVDSSAVVGVTISGSFPAAGIAVLSAIQVLGAKAVVASSLGASSYGANQPDATWSDMEQWLIDSGGLKYRSELVTPGGEGDSGGGLTDAGLMQLKAAASRCGVDLSVPQTLEESINRRFELFVNQNIDMFVNIGGNQAVLGACGHSNSIPNGLHRAMQSCGDSDRGLLVRMAETGIPVFHFLHVEKLAAAYELTREEPSSSSTLTPVYAYRRTEKVPVLTALVMIAMLVSLFRWKEHSRPGWFV